jgi:transcriptional regulator with XRE-family HTH domain
LSPGPWERPSDYGDRTLTGSRQSPRVIPLESFGSLLKRRRRNDDLTQAQLGKKLGVSQQTIGAWERGERPQGRFLDALSGYLGMGKDKLALLIDRQLPEDEMVNESDEAAEALTDSDDAMMRQLTRSFMEAQSRGMSSQEAEAFNTQFKYYGRDRNRSLLGINKMTG